MNHKTILQTLKRESLTDWERGFCESVSSALDKYGGLTEKQAETVQKLQSKYCPEAKIARENWKNNFTSEMRETMMLVAKYYRQNPPWYSDLAMKVVSDPEFVPTEKQYNAMCLNKYAQRVLENWRSQHIYEPGVLVVTRRGTDLHSLFGERPLVVLKQLPKTLTPTRGQNSYEVLPAGKDEKFILSEKEIKKLR